MSSILKALRKLEEEKSRSREGSTDIARDILKSGPRRQTSPWLAPVLLGVLVLTAGAVCVLLMAGGDFSSLPAEPGGATDSPALEQKSAPSAPERVAMKSASSSPPSEPSSPEKIASRPSSATAKIAVREPVVKAHPPRSPEKETVDPPPSLRLTGIAFQDGRESRLAVVNDLPVMEGTVIEGVRVMEISRDRVRFEASGRSFEVLLNDTGSK